VMEGQTGRSSDSQTETLEDLVAQKEGIQIDLGNLQMAESEFQGEPSQEFLNEVSSLEEELESLERRIKRIVGNVDSMVGVAGVEDDEEPWPTLQTREKGGK